MKNMFSDSRIKNLNQLVIQFKYLLRILTQMPPKQVKKGDGEDFSDLPNLPKANVFRFTIVFKSFFSQTNREKVSNKVQESLVALAGGNRITPLTREDITNYAKAKNIELQGTTEEVFARLASDRLFEMNVATRRQKKEKIDAIKQSAAAKGTEEAQAVAQEQIEGLNDSLDNMVYLVDYPQTKAEALAFAKYSGSLNGVFEVIEIPKPPKDEDEAEEEEESESQAEEQPAPEEVIPDSQQAQQQAQSVLNGISEAKRVCSAQSMLRQLAFLKVCFVDEPQFVDVTDADGNVNEKRREPEDAFLQDLITQYLDKYGQYWIQYQKFKELVTVDPLMPDKEARAQIRQLESELAQIQAGQDEEDAQFEEDRAAYEAEKQQLEGDDIAQLDTQFNEMKAQHETATNKRKERTQEINGHIRALRRRLPVSLDDERDPATFQDIGYKRDFVANNETSNNISSVLSAMITNIEHENYKAHENDSVMQGSAVEGSTEAETIDDLFSQWEEEIAFVTHRKDRGPDPKEQVSLADTMSQRHNVGLEIHDEQDHTLENTTSLPLALIETEGDRIATIQEREKEVFYNLNIPGKDRYLMPAVASKSKRARDAENPAFYPFCTLPIDDAERMLLLKQFQQLVKSNFIDQGASSENRHIKNKVFHRNFESHMSADIFKQAFASALLDEPDMATLYYPRTDSLLVALYHKANSPGHQQEKAPAAHEKVRAVSQPTLETGANTDGDRSWRAAYRVVPDFQNWLLYFADEIVFEQEVVPATKDETTGGDAPSKNNPKGKEVPQETESTAGLSWMKFQMDDELLPDRLIAVEDGKVQNVSEKSSMLYPDNNSIMRVDHYTIGGKTFSKSIIFNDNFKFGLRQRNPEEPQIKSEVDNGLVQYVPVGNNEIWVHFENGTKMMVELAQLKRCQQRLVEVAPPALSAEELAQKEEAIKNWQAACAKAQKGNKPAPSKAEFDVPETPKPTWEEEPLNYLDQLYEISGDDHAETVTTLTLRNGLFVRYLNGFVSQTHQEQVLKPEGEINRLVNNDGTVVRQFANRDAEVLFPDGVRAQFNKAELTWTITNTKGLRQSFKDGVYKDLDPIACATETDSVTGAAMTIREDNVVCVTYVDGSVYCQHPDGTRIHRASCGDGYEIRIEKDGFASHTIRRIDSHTQLEANTPEMLADNYLLIETFMPDGSMSQTFQQNGIWRHLLKRSDLSVVLVEQYGGIKLVTSNARAALNEAGRKVRLGDDSETDYLRILSEDIVESVFNANLSTNCEQTFIQTNNTSNGDQFFLYHNNTLEKRSPTCQNRPAEMLEIQEEDADLKSRGKMTGPVNQAAAQPGELEVEDTGIFLEPHNKYYQYPRFFAVAADGSAKELLSNEQLEYAMRQKKIHNDQSIQQKLSDIVNNQTLENHYFLTKVVNMKQKEIEDQKLKDIELPKNAADALSRNSDPYEEVCLQIPKQEQYLYSQILEQPEGDKFSQEAFKADYRRFKEWDMSQVRYNTEFAIQHVPAGKDQSVDMDAIKDEEFFNKRINLKILKYRAQPQQKFTAEQFKQVAMKEMASSGEVQQFRKTGSRLRSRGSNRSGVNSAGSQSRQAAEFDNRRPLSQDPNKMVSHKVKESDMEESAEDENSPKLKTEAHNEKEQRLERLAAKLARLEDKKNCPQFMELYFKSEGGQNYHAQFPPEKPSEEILTRMQQRINRTKSNFKGENSANNTQHDQNQNDEIDEKDNPIVALEPDQNMAQGSAFLGSRKDASQVQESGALGVTSNAANLPSLYMQEKMYIANKQHEDLLKSEEHHIVKTKDFNVYGRLREEKPKVKSIAKSNAQSELNERFITTECITDRRVKISSMAPRYYMNAPSVDDVRKQGQHQMILSAINKKQTFAELINQANSMVTGVLHDSLKRSLNVMPSTIQFGAVQTGSINEIIMTCKNEDSIAQRITIKPVMDKRISVKQLEYGIIAPGMVKKIAVTIRVNENEAPDSTINETLQIVTKHDIFKIPISAKILSRAQFEEENKQNVDQGGKPIQNSRVKERLMQKIEEGRQSQIKNHEQILTKKPLHDTTEEDELMENSGSQFNHE